MTKLNVQNNKNLLAYRQNPDGVTAEFEDGTTAHGTILVGADGANSKVRTQLLAGFEPVRNKAIMFNGDILLEEKQYKRILEHANSGVLYGQPGTMGTLLIREWLSDGKLLFHWDLGWSGGDSGSNHSWSEGASREQLYHKAVELTQHLPTYIADPIKRTGPEGMVYPPIKIIETVLPVDELPPGPVTLVGDAAHSMAPFRGERVDGRPPSDVLKMH
jgi:2-polyprenyl-6-methoxyphenol hydroxylase-like FAD-dependent oxidoreductase